MKDLRIAAVSMNCPVGRVRDNLDRMAVWVKAAKTKAAEIVCFPEMNITGYSTRNEIRNSAEIVPGPISKAVSAMARTFKIAILAGLAQKDRRGRIFASHLVVTPRGVIGVYRKIHIAPPEAKVFSAGDSIALFKIKGVRLGIQLCYDVHFPELSTHMATHGADVIFMPHASPRGTPVAKFDSWMRHLPARAFDNSLYVVVCNQTGSNQKGLKFPGLSVVLDPAGRMIKKNTDGKEHLLIADLKAAEIKKVRGHRMRYFLPNRRPDLY